MIVVVKHKEYQVNVRLHSGEVVLGGDVIGKVERINSREWRAVPNNGVAWVCNTRKDAVWTVVDEKVKENNRG